MKVTELIAAAPWREAVTYRDTWPHEYVLLRRDGQRGLFEAVCCRMCDGEAFPGSFFGRPTPYLFIGDHKYWFMTPCHQIDLDGSQEEHVLNPVPRPAGLPYSGRRHGPPRGLPRTASS